jgi:hypothetical protein
MADCVDKPIARSKEMSSTETAVMIAMRIALRVTCRPGDAVAVESPCYFGALLLLESMGLRALEMPTDPRNGLDPEGEDCAAECGQNPNDDERPATVDVPLARRTAVAVGQQDLVVDEFVDFCTMSPQV